MGSCQTVKTKILVKISYLHSQRWHTVLLYYLTVLLYYLALFLLSLAITQLIFSKKPIFKIFPHSKGKMGTLIRYQHTHQYLAHIASLQQTSIDILQQFTQMFVMVYI